MYLSDKNFAQKTIDDLRSIGLEAEIREEGREGKNRNSANILVAREKKVIEELKNTFPNKDHKRYGELMGFPPTAIKAYIKELERLPSQEQREIIGSIPDFFAGPFIFSKEYKDEEFQEVKRKIKLIAQYAPELFYDVYDKEEADRLIRESLEG